MAETDQTLVSTYDAFSAARGEEMDHLWAFSVSWKLMMNDVEVEQVREGLEEALALVRETQESPEDLFGDPKEHASELYRRWKSEGRLRLTHGEKIVAARSIPASSLHAGAWFALALALLELVDGDDLPATFLALPVGLGFAAVGGLALWERASRRWATPVAVAVMAAATLVLALVVASVLQSTDASLGSAMPWILVGEAVVLWFLGRCFTVLATAKAVVAARDGLDDEQWVERFSGILRGPGWTPEARVREIVAEARSHAAETGRTLAEEFGTPEHYASQFGMDRARRSRLTIALLALLIGLNVALQLDGWSWTGIAAVLLLAWMTWREYRRYRKHQERRGTGTQSAR
jgi:hypothetical protein